jgi:Tfp pilus assembly protein PilZ
MPSLSVFGERRSHRRKECILVVDLDDFQRFYKGHLRNLGLGGAFVEIENRPLLKVGQELAITIPYLLKSKKMVVRGKVVRRRANGMGVMFLSNAA